MKKCIAALALALAAPALAQEMPVPKMFKSMQGQKGQYQVEVLEGGGAGGKAAPAMTICTDNLMRPSSSAPGEKKPRADPDCKHRLLKDTADEAVFESVCKDRTSTTSMKREGKSILMTMSSTGGKRGPLNMKMRYTHLGACREGQGTVSMDKNSEQCRQMKEQAAQMDPAKACAGAGANRAQCEKQIRDAMGQMAGMCN